MQQINLLLLESCKSRKRAVIKSQLSAASFALKPDKMVLFVRFKLYRLSDGKLDREICCPLSEVHDCNCQVVHIRFEMCLFACAHLCVYVFVCMCVCFTSWESISWHTWTSFACSYFKQTIYLPVSAGFTVALSIILHRSLPRKAGEDSQNTSMVRL